MTSEAIDYHHIRYRHEVATAGLRERSLAMRIGKL